MNAMPARSRGKWLRSFLVVLVSMGAMSACQRSEPRVGEATPDQAPARPAPDSTITQESDEESPAGAVDVIRAYYHAIDERRYGDAYRRWGSDGEASGKTFEAFQAGFSETMNVEVTPGTPGPIEGAAGSRYIDVPVRVAATLRDGTTQAFVGTYTLRRAVVDGATAAQRAWHIASARIQQVR